MADDEEVGWHGLVFFFFWGGGAGDRQTYCRSVIDDFATRFWILLASFLSLIHCRRPCRGRRDCSSSSALSPDPEMRDLQRGC